MKQAGKAQSEIAEAVGFTQSTISKELARNRGERGYREKQAQSKADERQRARRRRGRVVIGALRECVEERLHRKHSPQQISGSLRREGIRVSHETLYRHILGDREAGGELYKNLRINGQRRYRRRCKAGRVGKIPNRIGIEKRPCAVDARRRYGDWEADLIEGKKGSGFLLSLYERKSRLGKLHRLESKGSCLTAEAIIAVLTGYRVRTLTYDNGLEFAGHERVSEARCARGYFCQPYHSWEKGGVENYNGLVRQYFPKGSDFRTISSSTLRRVEEEINQRPRKVLGYRSPSTLEQKLAA
jgi:IS30 family transposase